MSDTKTKYCRKCNMIKPVTDFYIHKDFKNGYHPNCKSCIKIKNKKIYSNRKFGDEIVKKIEDEILLDYLNEFNK